MCICISITLYICSSWAPGASEVGLGAAALAPLPRGTLIRDMSRANSGKPLSLRRHRI